MRCASLHQRRHLLHRAGTQHCQGLAGEASAPIGEEGRHIDRRVEHISIADDGAALREEFHHLTVLTLTLSSSSRASFLAARLYGRKYSTAQTKYTQTTAASPQPSHADKLPVSLQPRTTPSVKYSRIIIEVHCSV